MRPILIRHGQTPSNVVGALDTAFPGAPLTDLGEAQAAALPAALAHEPIAGIHASPLVRTQLTAAPLGAARSLSGQVVPGLEEITAGALEMRADEAARQEYAACLVGWMHGDLDRTLPGGADGHGFLERFDAAIGRLARSYPDQRTVAVITHGAAIRVYTAIRTGMHGDLAAQLDIRDTGAAVLDGCPTVGWHLEAWHPEPLGGPRPADHSATDVTGESAEQVAEESPHPG
ncbi:histidine phosphatase family protein [Arthrobacter bussei]|uniref:Histidine phosphatase family protein n=1 Tax=Arthrobacter bussei TaxID=2594179 RepID=A0A7X1NNP1_9MICC|nr:histidine phosphatase family protein [Arthrobacter bussei]